MTVNSSGRLREEGMGNLALILWILVLPLEVYVILIILVIHAL